jgi:hypothetical protein
MCSPSFLSPKSSVEGFVSLSDVTVASPGGLYRSTSQQGHLLSYRLACMGFWKGIHCICIKEMIFFSVRLKYYTYIAFLHILGENNIRKNIYPGTLQQGLNDSVLYLKFSCINFK